MNRETYSGRQPVEGRWDEREGKFVIERQESLPFGPKGLDVQLQGGLIQVLNCEEGEVPSVFTRVTAYGETRAEAQKTATEGDKFSVRVAGNNLVVEDRSQGGSGGSVVVGRNVVVGGSVSGITIVNGRIISGGGNINQRGFNSFQRKRLF